MSRGPGVYRFTSIGRPLDPAYASNRAVLWLMPAGALLYAALRWYATGGNAGLGSAAMTGLLLVFGAWALTRELAPDDNPAAFLATAIAFVTAAFVGSGSLLLVFVALFLVRIVNRSTGLAPTPVDALMVLGVTLWAAHSLGQPLLGVAGAAAFAADALLRNGRRWQLLPAAVCAAGVAYLCFRNGVPAPPEMPLVSLAWLLPGIISIAYLAAMLFLPAPVSRCDVTDDTLERTRIRGGMFVGWLVALQALFAGAPAPVLWACLAAVALRFLVAAVLRPRV